MSKLLVIAGETASGKSSLALELAQRFNGEIISADAWTVYRGFDIGTAKPSARDQALVRHHMIDVADAREGFSAARFKELAGPCIDEIAARGKLPILVGGTGLYVDSILYDYSFLSRADPQTRSRLDALPLDELQKQAQAAGLDTSTIDVQNKRRLIRLIENDGQLPTKQELRLDSLVIGLQPQRDELERRITARVDTMLAQGLMQEAKNLAALYGWDSEPMKGIGYREFHDYFSGSRNLTETRQKIITSTMQLAKKQRTWFTRNKSIHWFSTPVNYAGVVDFITTFLNT